LFQNQSSTICKVNVAELVSNAIPSSFGRGTETILDPNVRDSLEIPAEKLDPAGLQCIQRQIEWNIDDLSPNNPVQLKPYTLVIYQQGGHFDQHRDTVRGEGHIGTAAVILSSDYTGGELEITHGGKTEAVTGPYNWAAMYGDCLHQINPVTSGTRVSLIYDIYTTVTTKPNGKIHEAAAKCTEAVRQNRSEGNGEEDEKDDGGNGEECVNDNADCIEHDEKNGENGEGDAESEDADEESDGEGEEENVEKTAFDEDDHYCGEDPEFWSGGNKPHKFDEAKARGADAPAIHAALNKELQKYASVVICLQHMYPACQAVPSHLKGVDAVLYEVLQDHYEMQVVQCSIYYKNSYDKYEGIGVSGSLVGSFEKNSACRKRTKLVIPTQLNYDRILDYTPYIEHTGNESQAEETMYVVAGLRVWHKM
jgi:predicted 2-oxoglutarate/Fe(II)-dependent dioxygenase YbiX